MIHSDADREPLWHAAAAGPTVPQRFLAVQTPSATVRYLVATVEETADPEAWFVELATADRLTDGSYPAELEQGRQQTPGVYTVVTTAGKLSRSTLQGVFRRA